MCGITALFSQQPAKLIPIALSAAKGLQHRGQQGAGLAMQTKNGIETYKNSGLLQDVFTDNVINCLNKPCQWVLIHCRYGTFGNYDPINLQPCIANSLNADKFAVIHNGEFVGLSGKDNKGVSDTYLFTKILALEKSKDWDKKVLNCIKNIKGAYSLVIGINDTLYIARDPHGIRPLYLGQISTNRWMVASETHAFSKICANAKHEVRRGRLIKISKDGLITLKKGGRSKKHFCDFELAYFSRPDSCYRTNNNFNKKNWQSFAGFRERCGRILADRYTISNGSFVVGVPDSGISLATGYSQKSGIPYRQVIIRDHADPNGNQRLFMRDDNLETIGEKVLGKLSLVPDKKIWKDKIVIVGDDSIVRGNVSKRITKAIFKLGAKEVHWIIGFPPIIRTCHLGVSIRTNGELIACKYKGDTKKIALAIGATSVFYISPKDFIQAKSESVKVVLPKTRKYIFLSNGGCGGCITGLYPINKI